MKCTLALIPLLVVGGAHAGQPLHAVLKLRTIEVLRCEAVTPNNVGELSSFVRAASRNANANSNASSNTSSNVRPDPAKVTGSVPGLLVEGVVKKQRDITFPHLGRGDPISDTQWTDAHSPVPLKFFASGTLPEGCEAFALGKRVNLVLSQKAECDTHPPAGVCAFDHPVSLVDPATWARYGP